MIRISKQTDYGIILLTIISAKGKEPSNARGLSDDTGIPLPMVQKILKLLTRSSILRSQRGASGGYTLSGEPENISVAKIIESLEGPIAITECCSDENKDCSFLSRCPTTTHWNVINKTIKKALGGLTL